MLGDSALVKSLVNMSLEGEKPPGKEWYGPFHPSASKPIKKSSYLIILNTPIRFQTEQLEYDQVTLFQTIWDSTKVRICADGGANRLYDFSHENQHRFFNSTPNYIKGDLDSIREDVKFFFQGQQDPLCRIIFDPDQDTTDLGKCLKLVKEIHQSTDTTNSGTNHSDSLLIIHGGLCGRLDQTIHTLHNLLTLQLQLQTPSSQETWINQTETCPETWVIDTEARSMACALEPGVNHRLHIPKLWRQGPHPLTCGILPMAGNQATVTTIGLKWNLNQTKTSMLGLLSTSNHILPETDLVQITTDQTIIWTMEIPIHL